MQIRPYTLLIIASIILITSCTKKVSIDEYMHFIEKKDNGYLKENIVNGYNYRIQYKPTNYVALLELRRSEVTQEELDEMKKQFSQSMHFTLTLQCDSCELNKLLESDADSTHAGLIRYLDFEVRNDIQLVNEKDTLPCKLYLHERPSAGDTRQKLIFAFDRSTGKKISDDFRIIFNDRYITHTQQIFDFKKKDLTTEPLISL